MKIRFGIRIKLFFWYLALISIFYGTIFALFNHIRQIMKISENVVSENYEISSGSKKMIENLLSLEENEKKYNLLKKDEYRDYFIAAQREFEKNLTEILKLTPPGAKKTSIWEELHRSYQEHFPIPITQIGQEEASKTVWISEDVLNDWMQQITRARSDNERDLEWKMVALNRRGQMAVRWGSVGLGVSLVVGLLGMMFLARTMNRPLRELLRGIRSIPQVGSSEPIQVLSKDEFGELARAFNEMAARLSQEERMRSDFISMLSHEIRTPLTSIRESVNLIAEEVMGPINDRQKRFLEIASQEMERISGLLNHLMQVSRMEAGAVKIQPRPLEPSIFVDGGLTRMKAAAEAKGIRIQTRMVPDLPQVMGDPEHLQQVLLNLLGNAIKFSPSGSDVVVCVEGGGAGRELRFSVSDNGPGIPQDEVALIFHKYYRASGIRDQVDGVGLGLSISKLIVEAHGGTVWVKSQVGQGSTFGFTLPVVQKE